MDGGNSVVTCVCRRIQRHVVNLVKEVKAVIDIND